MALVNSEYAPVYGYIYVYGYPLGSLRARVGHGPR